MRCKVLVLLVAAAVALGSQPAPKEKTPPEKSKKAAKLGARKAPKARTLTGCVDQQGSDYVLAENQELRQVAILQSEIFEKEGFAKYLGNRVKVTGDLKTEGGVSVLKVRRIERISEVCNPAPGS